MFILEQNEADIIIVLTRKEHLHFLQNDKTFLG